MRLLHVRLLRAGLFSAGLLVLGACFDSPSPSGKQTLTPALPVAYISEVQNVSLDAVGTGALMVRTQKPGEYIIAPLLSTHVEMRIAGPVIRTKLSQTFENKSDKWIEGTYVFPLPENAAVDRLRMVIGGRFIEGRVEEKKKAREIYEQARTQGRRAGLVEQNRPNIFTTSLANIGPGERVAVQIEYQDIVQRSGKERSLRFPMVVAPRYHTSSPDSLDSSESSEEQGMPASAPLPTTVLDPRLEPIYSVRLPVSMDIYLTAGFDTHNIASAYHPILTKASDKQSYHISLKDGEVPANRDFKLSWEPTPQATAQTGVFKQKVGQDMFILTQITPPEIKKEGAYRLARESIFVIDVSGSMHGASLVAARKALEFALDELTPTDWFNVISFNNNYKELFEKSVPANQANIATARRYILALQASGGTEMREPLRASLRSNLELAIANETVRQVFFITDGTISYEKELFGIIGEYLGRSRMFFIGIGSAPNAFFMSRAADHGRGFSVLIDNLSEVKDGMQAFFLALDTPLITNVSHTLYEEGKRVESYPSLLPDLYHAQPLLSISKVGVPNMPESIILGGKKSGDTGFETWQEQISLRDAVPVQGLSVLWARHKIKDLESQKYNRALAPQIDSMVLQTALDYHIVSRLTSLVAVEKQPPLTDTSAPENVRPENADLAQLTIPTQLPEGWSFGRLAFEAPRAPARALVTSKSQSTDVKALAVPRTNSPHIVYMLIGLLIVLGGIIVLFWPALTWRHKGHTGSL